MKRNTQIQNDIERLSEWRVMREARQLTLTCFSCVVAAAGSYQLTQHADVKRWQLGGLLHFASILELLEHQIKTVRRATPVRSPFSSAEHFAAQAPELYSHETGYQTSGVSGRHAACPKIRR